MSNFCEECMWWVKAKLSSNGVVAVERAQTKYEKTTKPLLLSGAIFQWIPVGNDAPSSSGASSLLASALSNFSTVLGGSAEPGKKPGGGKSKPVEVLLRLKLPEKSQGAPDPGMMEKLASYVGGNGDTTKLVWTSLELDKNQPKYEGGIDLHMVQTIKVEDSELTLKDHQNNVLFQGKGEAAKAWNEYLLEALKVMGPQLEDEAAAHRGVTYRSKQLERLEARQKEWGEKRKKLGDVPMGYTARILMARAEKPSSS